MIKPHERTTSEDRALERKTPTKELSIGQSVTVTRGMGKEVALGSHMSVASHFGRAAISGSSRDGGDKGSQSWDQGKEPHNLRLSGKDCEG